MLLGRAELSPQAPDPAQHPTEYPVSFFEPLHCRIDAFTALRDQLPGLDSTDGLVRAASAVSMHELDEVQLLGVEAALDDLADQVQGRMVGNNPRAVVAHAHAVLFDEARFRGNMGDYDSPANSYLPRVLQTRLGLPITLVLVYKAVLKRLGIQVFGINAPGHFLAAVPSAVVGDTQQPDGLSIIDPFTGGRLMSREEALDRIVQAAGGERLLDESEDLLPIATHKQWLTRIIRNLNLCFEKQGNLADAHAMAEMLLLVQAEGA